MKRAYVLEKNDETFKQLIEKFSKLEVSFIFNTSTVSIWYWLKGKKGLSKMSYRKYLLIKDKLKENSNISFHELKILADSIETEIEKEKEEEKEKLKDKKKRRKKQNNNKEENNDNQ